VSEGQTIDGQMEWTYEGFPFEVGHLVEVGDDLGVITCIDGPGTQTPGSELVVEIKTLSGSERKLQGWWSEDRLGNVLLRHVTAPRTR
jgi:hypothetical protein